MKISERSEAGGFVAGGTRGIGASIAFALQDAGQDVSVCGRTVSEPPREGMHVFQADVTCEDDLIKAMRASNERTPLRSVVLAAGLPVFGTVESLDLADWDRCLDVNLRAAFLVARTAIPILRANGGGGLVFVSSIWSMTTPPNRAAYITAKTGVSGLTRSLALDHAGDGIRVNAVAPGYIESPALLSLFKGKEDELEVIRRKHPLGRLGTMDDVAHMVAFLLSDKSANLTGQTLALDGGMANMFAI